MELLPLNALILVPVIAYFWARSYRSKNKFTYLGVAFGLIVLPFSMGLYSFYFLGPFGFVPGMIGLIFTLFHNPPGYYISMYLGLLDSKPISDEMPQRVVVIGLLNAVVWGLVYGCVGYGIDAYLKKIKRNNAST